MTKIRGRLDIKAGTTLREATYLIFRNVAKGASQAERVEIAREVARLTLDEQARRWAKVIGPVTAVAVEELAQRILADNPIEN